MSICTHARTHSDLEKIQSGIGDKVAVFLSYFSTFIAGYIIAFARSWKQALVVMTVLPILAVIGAAISKVLHNVHVHAVFFQTPRVLLRIPFFPHYSRLLQHLLLESRVPMQLLEQWQRRCCPPYVLWWHLEERAKKLSG